MFDVSFNFDCISGRTDKKPSRKVCGFTLIELLVVIAIIALLVSILLPSLNKAKSLAKGAVCLMKLKSISTAHSFYFNDYNAAFPPMYGFSSTDPGWAAEDSWRCVLLEYMDTQINTKASNPAYTYYEVYTCPEVSKDAPRYGYSYGMNDDLRIFNTTDPWPTVSDVSNPASTVQNGDNDGPLQLLDYDRYIDSAPLHIPNFRHLEKANLLMVDGHCESCSLEDLENLSLDKR